MDEEGGDGPPSFTWLNDCLEERGKVGMGVALVCWKHTNGEWT